MESEEEIGKLNLRLKSQFAGEFIQMITEVKLIKKLKKGFDAFIFIFFQAMESKCFSRCVRKPGNQIENSEEVLIITTRSILVVNIIL